MSIMFSSCGTKFCVSQFFAYFGTLFYVLFQIFMRFVYNQPQKCVKKAAAQTPCAAASGLQSFLQDAGADGVCYLKQVFLPDKAELGLVAVRKADRQLGRLQRVAKARRLDAVVQHLAVR